MSGLVPFNPGARNVRYVSEGRSRLMRAEKGFALIVSA